MIKIPKEKSWKDNFTFYDLNKTCPAGFPINLISLCTCFENHETGKVTISIKKKIIKQIVEEVVEEKVKSQILKNHIYNNVRFKIDLDTFSKGFFTSTNCSDEEFEKIKNELPQFKSKKILNLTVMKIVEPCLEQLRDYADKSPKSTKDTLRK